MNSYFKIYVLILFVSSVSLYGGTLQLIKGRKDVNHFFCNIEASDFLLLDDLIDIAEAGESEEVKKKTTPILLGIEGGADYSHDRLFSVSLGISLNFDSSSIGTEVRTTVPDFSKILLDLTYRYNFSIHRNFALFAGGGSAVVLEFIADYNLNILNGVGFTIDAGITWVTGINLNISLRASYYGLYFFPDDSYRNLLFIGTSLAYNTRRWF